LKRFVGTSLLTLSSCCLGLTPCAAASQPTSTVEVDLAYVEGGGPKQQLDLYTPAAADFPTILFVHGGSLTSGDRREEEAYGRMCRTFQDLGIACAAMSYRLAPEFQWPAQPADVAAGFGWLRRNIAARGGDVERIFLFGHSSGCLLVALVATDPRYLREQGASPRDVAGVVPMGCRLDDRVEVTDTAPARYEATWVPPDRVAEFLESEPAFTSLGQRNEAVPALYVGADLPPTLVLIAEDERFFPPVLRDAAEFVGRALAAGAEAEIAILADRRHMTEVLNMVTADDPAVQRVVEFVRAH
jgi:arylformamidase